MKIDRSKLNTLLRSGLNPNIKTRKHLAAHLKLDPTSLTRWFSSRDRLGNPRYPVVPDRHVAIILQLFKLDPSCLSLDDEAFRNYCFELALQRSEESSQEEKKAKTRSQNIARRRLSVPTSTPPIYKKRTYHALAASVLALIAWIAIDNVPGNESLITEDTGLNIKMKCWSGYSPELGVFEKEDKSDPCHYGKLFHNALALLKSDNNKQQSSVTKDYLLFLSQSLDHRRILERVLLNMELGRIELNNRKYAAALSLFQSAKQDLSTLPDPYPELLAEIDSLASLASGNYQS